MSEAWRVFPASNSLKGNLAAELRKKGDIFSLSSEPLLGPLATCLGLQSEIGHSQRDRLSFPLGIDLSKFKSNPWHSEVITFQNLIGLRFWIPEVSEFKIRHPDFKDILHPLSLDKYGKLSQIVIFPTLVAEHYQKRGLELVIVRDWALSSFLAPDQSLNYLQTNIWEIETNSAYLQTRLMNNRQIAFSGTHDVADHLLDGNQQGMAINENLYSKASQLYEKIFSRRQQKKKITLLASYLVGVLLDDLAQPNWYSSLNHRWLTDQALHFLAETEKLERDIPRLELPQSFHNLIKKLRSDRRHRSAELQSLFDLFTLDLCVRLLPDESNKIAVSSTHRLLCDDQF